MKNDLTFGQRVRVGNKLERREKRKPEDRNNSTLKVWEENPFKDFEPTEGIFLGYRTVNDGRRTFWSDHIEYRPEDYYTVALVAVGPNKNPFYSTDVEPLEEVDHE